MKRKHRRQSLRLPNEKDKKFGLDLDNPVDRAFIIGIVLIIIIIIGVQI